LASNSLPFHNVYVIHVDALEVSVYQKHDGQSHRGFRRGDGYYEYGEYLPHKVRGRDKLGESHEVDINRIEHQLDRHQDADGVSASQNAKDAHTEKNGAQSQKVSQADQDLLLPGDDYRPY
jgi:uncharacterized protein YpmB